jgi:triosephosphate isomerase
MSRRKIVAGNWKMNKNNNDALQLIRDILATNLPRDIHTVLALPSIYLKNGVDMLMHIIGIDVAAQNCHQEQSGAFTGEISAPMLSSISVPYVVIGHSERRQYFYENNEQLAQKVDVALANGLQPIFCCGESLDIRKNGDHVMYVSEQIRESLFHLSDDKWANIIIAYEPIWAIGTGETASPGQAQEMHAALRSMIGLEKSADIADNLSILYGGSVKSTNAADIFGGVDVDGALVGGASLDAGGFLEIVEALAQS